MNNLLERAVEHHSAGRLDQAIALYQQILTEDPHHAGACANYAAALRTQGKQQEALPLLEVFLRQVSGDVNILNIYGLILDDLGQVDQAISVFNQLLASTGSAGVKVNLAEALRKRCLTVKSKEQLDLAVRLLEEAIQSDPALLPAYYELGLLCLFMERYDRSLEIFEFLMNKAARTPDLLYRKAAGYRGKKQYEETIACYRELLTIQPNIGEALVDLGGILMLLKRPKEALEPLQKGIALLPNNIEGLANLGTCYHELDRYQEAEPVYRKAIGLAPHFYQLYRNFGAVLTRLYKFDEALTIYYKGKQLTPLDLELDKSIALCLRQMGRGEEAKPLYQAILNQAPPHSDVWGDTHLSLAEIALNHGDFETGLWHYEHRKTGTFAANRLPKPAWKGEDISGKTLLILGEQGMGDILQFCRYIPMVKAKGVKVVFWLHHKTLARLMESLDGIDQQLVLAHPHNVTDAEIAALPPHDFHCYLLSLPYLLGTRLETIPDSSPYLKADPLLVAQFKQKLDSQLSARGTNQKLKVGLVWSSNPLMGRTAFTKSLSLSVLEPLLTIEGVQFVSLQKGEAARELTQIPTASTNIINFMDDITDFSETAALIESLDLVISVDTSVAHLAGALAKPVWGMLCFNNCWRWLENRSDSPWYKSLKLYRQLGYNDWAGLVETIKQDLVRYSSLKRE